MNTNNTSSIRIRRAKRTLLGKILCRLAGEERGAVMMEYVIVAVMIAAAVAVGAWFFGKDILNMFGVAGRASTGDITGARELQKQSQTDSKTGHGEAATQDKAFIKTGEATTTQTSDNL